MRLVFASLLALFLLWAGLFGRARTVQAGSDEKPPLSAIPAATERAVRALDLLGISNGPLGL